MTDYEESFTTASSLNTNGSSASTSPGFCSFQVAGIPITQGSMKAWVNKKTGRAHLAHQKGKGLDAWRTDIAAEARDAWDWVPLDGVAVELTASFTLLRPKSEPKTRRTWPIKARSGDVDKLLRAVMDALTGVIFCDDSQVVDAHVRKDWADDEVGPGVHITITEC